MSENNSNDHISNVVSHVASFFFTKNSFVRPALELSFFAETKRTTSRAVMRELFANASKSATSEISGSQENFWHFYQDYLVKLTQDFDKLETKDQNTAMMDMVIFSGWNAKNFSRWLGFELPSDPPSLFSDMKDIKDYKIFLSYMEESVVPALKKGLRTRLKLDKESLDSEINAREQYLIKTRVTSGIDIVMPPNEVHILLKRRP